MLNFEKLKQLIVFWNENTDDFIEKIQFSLRREEQANLDELLNLAITNEKKQYVRVLINFGATATLPIQINFIRQHINPVGFILYCSKNGIYQLLTKDEITKIDLLETQKQLSLLSLQRSILEKKPYKKFYQRLVTKDDIENIIFQLIHKYLYLCNRKHKESRENKHSLPSKQLEQRLLLSKVKRESLLKMIHLLVITMASDTTTLDSLDQNRLITDDDSTESSLRSFIITKQNQHERYFGDDLSDNSDSEDEKKYLYHLSNPQETTGTIGGYLKISQCQNELFWFKTRLTTPKKAGLKDKITENLDNLGQIRSIIASLSIFESEQLYLIMI